jgi:hypothetical protein
VVAHHDPTYGGLPAWGSLLEVQPERAVRIGALKALGNPTARGSAQHADPADGVVVRVVETRGRSAEVSVQSGLRHISAPRHLNLIEDPLVGDTATSRLHGYEIATLRTDLNLPRVLDAERVSLAPDAEPVQPLYARYWLHNRGPAPLGGLPAVAHLHPHRLDVVAGDVVPLRLTAASDATDTAVHGVVRMVAPREWSIGVPELSFVLPAGEYLESTVEVGVPADVAPGLYPVLAELAVTGGAIPASWHQTVEDVAVLSVGQHDDRLLRMVSEPSGVDVAAGGTATLGVTIGTDAYVDLTVEAHVISPWGTWEWLRPNIVGGIVRARGTLELSFDVAPPPWTEPGQWWALIRVACAGELLYSQAARVVVR